MGKIYRDGIAYAGGGNVKECTLAQYNEWKANGQLVKGVTYDITDAPNLNATAKQISYDGTTTSVWDEVEDKSNKTQNATFTAENGVSVMHISSGYTDKQGCISAEIRFTGSANAWKTLGTLSIKPNDACQVVGIHTGTGAHLGIVRLRDNGIVEVYPIIAINNDAVGFSISFVMA